MRRFLPVAALVFLPACSTGDFNLFSAGAAVLFGHLIARLSRKNDPSKWFDIIISTVGLILMLVGYSLAVTQPT